MLSVGARRYDRSGRVRVIVLIAVVVLVAGIAVVFSRLAGGRGGTVVDEASEPVVGEPDSLATGNTPPVVRALNELEYLVDSAIVEAMALEEPETGATANQMRRVEQEWHAWATGFGERLEEAAAKLPVPPGDESERELRLGYNRMVSAIEQLRRLVPTGSTVEVPRLVIRQSILGTAKNHLESARTYFYRIGL